MKIKNLFKKTPLKNKVLMIEKKHYLLHEKQNLSVTQIIKIDIKIINQIFMYQTGKNI